jgi:hypothetical protein
LFPIQSETKGFSLSPRRQERSFSQVDATDFSPDGYRDRNDKGEAIDTIEPLIVFKSNKQLRLVTSIQMRESGPKFPLPIIHKEKPSKYD